MTIDLVFITFNRLDYTKLALASVLADPSEEFGLTIWDNASTDGTVQYLQENAKDRRIKEVVFSKENVGQVKAVNEIWKKSKADLLGKLDNDYLVTPGWTRTFATAHQDIQELGVVCCWHYFPEDFDFERAKHKIQTFGRHKILRHPWTTGSGLLFKRDIYRKLGPMKGDATTQYWMKMAMAGYVNGFYYPLIYQEHMDDMRSQHNRTRHMSFEEAYKTCHMWRNGSFRTQEDYKRLNERILDTLLTGPYDPRYYHRPVWRKVYNRLKRMLSLNKGVG